ncbi:helix-turn-helix domain-containing protein [Aquimarina algicola]|uniref:helix-turn-helix domain-containing protein n=1 Tax=Aquimarina algicola TaxID=2589995 RepID=UPI001CF1AFF3|nr:helix-turn-helix domain-containing protein [Aquimarina algicola]
MSDEVTQKILISLDKFERNQKFCDSNLTLTSLAKELNTNNKYLSKIINLHKQKSFTQYIHDLRINYFIDHLKEEKSKYRSYNIKGIADDLGFKTSRSFSTAFHKKMNRYPSDYIKEIKIKKESSFDQI